MGNISNKWDSPIPIQPKDPSKVFFASKKYIYFGSSLKGRHLDRLILVAKVVGVFLATLALIPIPILILTGGYGAAGKAIQELTADIHIEGRTPTKKNFIKHLKNYLSNELFTPEIKNIIESLPEACITAGFLYLKSCKKLRIEGLPIGKSAYERDLATHQALWTKVLQAKLEIIDRQLQKAYLGMLNFCDQYVMPMTQNVEMKVAGETAVPGEFTRLRAWLEKAKEKYTTPPESNWIAEGYMRLHDPLPIFELFTCAESPEKDLWELTLITRIAQSGSPNVSERSKIVLIDLRPLRQAPDKTFNEAEQMQLLHGLVDTRFVPKWLTTAQNQTFQELILKNIIEIEKALVYVYER